jgi:hypothetical protein
VLLLDGLQAHFLREVGPLASSVKCCRRKVGLPAIMCGSSPTHMSARARACTGMC